jgi:soluble lytic murein transglycosylase-like protein
MVMNRAIQICLCSILFSNFSFASDLNVCERHMASAAVRYKIPLGVLYAVGMTESGRKGSLHPFALNVEGKTYFASSKREALMVYAKSRLSGAKLIDLGCMQINVYYHRKEFSSLDAMLDPATNIEYAAKFLNQLKIEQGSWTMAVARYHAGPNNKPAQKKYICLVVGNLVASGFGSWTPEAKALCRPK